MISPVTFSTFLTTPAKVNLGLKIVRRRKDGYHDIYTVMEPVALSDTIYCEFRPGSENSFMLESPQMMDLDTEDNLVVKAARKMVDRARDLGQRQKGAWTFWLDKKIPSGAGLGGGSSNAAGVLKLLEDFYNLEISQSELIEMAVDIGADVPFFLEPKLALIEGIGERITPLANSKKRYYLLIKPSFAVNTGWAYAGLNAGFEKSEMNYNIEQFGNLSEGARYILENDFETPVEAVHPQISEIKAWLEDSSGSQGVLMSGSGSVVYAIYSNFEAAMQAEIAARDYWRAAGCDFFLTRNL